MSEHLDLTATELASQIKRGALSAETLMEDTLSRISAVNGTVNAIISQRAADEVLAEARAADQVASEDRGPLHGLPIAIKDLANAKGLPTSMGSPLFAGIMPPKDDEAVARVRGAGAIVIGKTNTPEFGLGSHTTNPVFGATCTPYDPSRTAGGSSGGAAAALATGMLPIADGSDMMGSLRNPAAWNNVYGLRPTYGRVPLDMPGDAFSHQLAVAGPMGRSPEDVALLLDVQAGLYPKEPHSFVHDPVVPQLGETLTGKRIGWLGDWGGAYPMEDGVLATCEASLAQFETLGAKVDRLDPPFPAAKIWDAWVKLRAWANAGGKLALFETEEMRAQLNTQAIWEIETGLTLSAVDIHKASAVRTEWFRTLTALFDTYDALLLPSAQVWPFPKEWDWPKEIAGHSMDTYHRWMEVVIPVSLVGVPCLNIPAGFSDTGLPMGLQMFGPRLSDGKLLGMGQRWHEHVPYPHQRPDLSVLTS